MKALVYYEGITSVNIPNLIKNDTGFSITFYIRNENNTEVDLTGTTTILIFKQVNAITPKFSGLCVLTAPLIGECVYTFTSTDLDTAGAYYAELQVTSSSGVIRTAPLGRVSILEDL